MRNDDRREPPDRMWVMVFAFAMVASAAVGSLIYLIAYVIPLLRAAARRLS